MPSKFPGDGWLFVASIFVLKGLAVDVTLPVDNKASLASKPPVPSGPVRLPGMQAATSASSAAEETDIGHLVRNLRSNQTETMPEKTPGSNLARRDQYQVCVGSCAENSREGILAPLYFEGGTQETTGSRPVCKDTYPTD